MRKIALVVPALLVACTTAPAAPIIHGETPGHTCNAAGLENYLGRAGTRETGAQIQRSSHAAVLRWAPPGVMLTMDYRADRVTIYLDDRSKITKINCG